MEIYEELEGPIFSQFRLVSDELERLKAIISKQNAEIGQIRSQLDKTSCCQEKNTWETY